MQCLTNPIETPRNLGARGSQPLGPRQAAIEFTGKTRTIFGHDAQLDVEIDTRGIGFHATLRGSFETIDSACQGAQRRGETLGEFHGAIPFPVAEDKALPYNAEFEKGP